MNWHYPENDDYPPEYALCFSDWVIADNGYEKFPAILDHNELQWYRPGWPVNFLSINTYIKCSVTRWKSFEKEEDNV